MAARHLALRAAALIWAAPSIAGAQAPPTAPPVAVDLAAELRGALAGSAWLAGPGGVRVHPALDDAWAKAYAPILADGICQPPPDDVHWLVSPAHPMGLALPADVEQSTEIYVWGWLPDRRCLASTPLLEVPKPQAQVTIFGTRHETETCPSGGYQDEWVVELGALTLTYGPDAVSLSGDGVEWRAKAPVAAEHHETDTGSGQLSMEIELKRAADGALYLGYAVETMGNPLHGEAEARHEALWRLDKGAALALRSVYSGERNTGGEGFGEEESTIGGLKRLGPPEAPVVARFKTERQLNEAVEIDEGPPKETCTRSSQEAYHWALGRAGGAVSPLLDMARREVDEDCDAEPFPKAQASAEPTPQPIKDTLAVAQRHMKAHQYAEAVTALTAQVERLGAPSPAHERLHGMLTRAYLKSKDQARAWAAGQRCLEIAASAQVIGSCLYNLARVAEGLGRWQQAGLLYHGSQQRRASEAAARRLKRLTSTPAQAPAPRAP